MKNTHQRTLIWLIVGVCVGIGLMQFWPQTPLHATATDRLEGFAMATGLTGEDVEAVYFLDFLTGDLRAAVIGNQSGKFNAFYQRNILEDLGVDPSKNPRFLMVTGRIDLRRGQARLRPSNAALYVAELSSGKVAAYALPWDEQAHASGRPAKGDLIPLDVMQFRTTAVRE